MKRKTIAALAAMAILASPAFAQAPGQTPAQPAAPAISPEAIQAAQALSAYQRGQTMTRNAAVKLCQLGQPAYCGEASAPAQGQPTTAQGGTTANPPNTTGGARR